jgi:ligand-binding sensor domain-containing protein
MKTRVLSLPHIITGMVLFFCLLCQTATAENLVRTEYGHRRYTTHDGLPNLLLETIFQDSRGFLWIGTYKGFARFDGITYTPFFAETAINILRLENGPNGEVRAYTYHDVFIVDKNDSVRTVNIAPADLYLNTYNSRNLPEGYLIFENEDATEKYLKYFRNDTLIEILRCPELNGIIDNKPFLDLQENKFYLPSLDGLNIYDMKTHKAVRIKNRAIECFLMHHSLGILGFDNDGIYKINETSCEKIVSARFGNNKQAVELTDGDIVLKDDASTYRYSKGSVETVFESSAAINDVLCDAEKNLWLATNNGLYNYFRFDFKNYYLEKDLIKTVLEDTDGNYWMGTIRGKLLHTSERKTQAISYPPLPRPASFLYGSLSAGGFLYFPRDNDVLISEKGKFSWAGLPIDLTDYDGFCKVVPYKDDQILVLRGKGVHLCDKNGKSLRFYSGEFLKQLDFQDLIVDSQGRWVVSGHLGISIVEGDSVRLMENKKNTTTTVPLCLDMQGNIWSGSENRLNLLRGDSIETVYRFKDDFIQGIISVDKDYLLLSTIHGIYFLNVAEYIHSGKIQFLHYDHNNGLTGMEAQVCAFYKDSQGIIWMPANDCLTVFDPVRLIRKLQPPRLHIESCDVSTDNVHWEKVIDLNNRKFSYKNRNFQFSFIGINFSAVENVRYSYRLKGFQEEWSSPSKLRQANFNNLPPGDYVFEIYADAGSDATRSEVQSFAFTIQPAFWQTAWFMIAAVLALMLSSAGVALYIQRRKNRVLLEHLETEKQLNDLRIKSIRLKAIPHFNSNVLAAIEYYIMNLSKTEALRLLGIYSRFTFQTLREVDRSSRSLNEELEYVKMYLELEKLRFIDKFDYKIEVDEAVNTEVQLPNMILHTYCENAVKHGLSSKTSGGALRIKITQSDDIVCVSVEDNGVGREAAARNKQVPSSKQGLDILSRQIEIYNRFNQTKINQKVDDLYTDGQASGTRFAVEIPYGFVYQ